MDSSTYSQVSLGAGILSAAGEGGADNGRDGVLARGTGELSAGGLRDGGGDLADDALMRVLLDLECRRHGGWWIVWARMWVLKSTRSTTSIIGRRDGQPRMRKPDWTEWLAFVLRECLSQVLLAALNSKVELCDARLCVFVCAEAIPITFVYPQFAQKPRPGDGC